MCVHDTRCARKDSRHVRHEKYLGVQRLVHAEHVDVRKNNMFTSGMMQRVSLQIRRLYAWYMLNSVFRWQVKKFSAKHLPLFVPSNTTMVAEVHPHGIVLHRTDSSVFLIASDTIHAAKTWATQRLCVFALASGVLATYPTHNVCVRIGSVSNANLFGPLCVMFRSTLLSYLVLVFSKD